MKEMKKDRNVSKKSLVTIYVFFTSVLDVILLRNENGGAG